MRFRLWWLGGAGDRRTIHWRSWDSLCTPKCLGGLGFRDMAVFNEVCRQALRFTSAPNSLLGKVMRAKYYPHSTFLDSALDLVCSHSWRSIWGSKALLKEGLIWRVGNGRDIKVWSDPWVADEHGRFLTSSLVVGNLQANKPSSSHNRGLKKTKWLL